MVVRGNTRLLHGRCRSAQIASSHLAFGSNVGTASAADQHLEKGFDMICTQDGVFGRGFHLTLGSRGTVEVLCCSGPVT